jgi:hypothetical protein
MKKATIFALMLGMVFCVPVMVTSLFFPGLGEQAIRTAIAEPTAAASKPTPSTPVVPETCVLPPYENLPKITIGREGRDGQVIDCALRAFRELFPGCGDPATDPEDFSLQLYEAWLEANGFDVKTLPDADGDGIVDPVLYPNQVLIGYWKGGSWSDN